MKTGILTYHFADNYGAVLQCYALKKYLEIIGKEVEVIDYKPFDDRAITKEGQHLKNIYRIMRQSIYDIRTKGVRKKQIAKFEEFRNKYLNVGISNYNTVFLGSDQIWNPNINNYDLNYFGKEVKSEKYISYAASIGISEINEKCQSYIKEGLELVDFISVREEDAKKICKNLTSKSIEVVVDPVFLVNKESYNELIEKFEFDSIEKYILVYSLEHNDLIDKHAKSIAQKKGLKIKYIHPHAKHYQYAHEYEDTAGPIEFLNLMKNASFIISNSFHALAFSMIFEVPTITIMHHKVGSARQRNLIKIAELEYEKLDENTYFIEQPRINNTMNECINNSKKFIENA